MLVLVEKAAEAIASSYVEAGNRLRIDRRGQWVQRAGIGDALMGAMGVVEPLELAQGVEQVPLVPDQRAVQELATAGLHPPFHDRIHSRHLDAAEHDLDPRICQNGIEQAGNFPSRSLIM